MKKGVKNQLSFISHYRFRQRLLEYSAVRTITVVAESFTSKTCCRCGYIDNNLSLKGIYDCTKCINRIERDTNAAINIYQRCIWTITTCLGIFSTGRPLRLKGAVCTCS
mmetsp:Transcript_16630/g.26968  ORF Transcript_16630/g.26968 Transcript_16630/m.26968 type:complete len:109 (-) Transcript_16630:827-1153(-)